jgi:hypothetical protein
MSLAALQALVRVYARVPAEVVGRNAGGQEARAIADAVREYSRRRPRRLNVSLNATGAASYAMATLVTGWNDEQFRLRAVSQKQGGAWADIDLRDWRVVRTAAGTELHFVSPPTGLLNLDYLGPHQVDSEVDTVPADDQEALAHLAACYVLTQAANEKIPQNSSAMGADSVDQSEQRKGYALQARDELAAYERLISGKAQVHAVSLNLDTDPWGGSGRFWSRR